MAAWSVAAFSEPKFPALPCADSLPVGDKAQYPEPVGVAAARPPVGAIASSGTGGAIKGGTTGSTTGRVTLVGAVTGGAAGGAGGAAMLSTVKVKLCVASGTTPFAAWIVSGYVPA